MQDYRELQSKVTDAYKRLNIDSLVAEKSELSSQMQNPDFWFDKSSAQATSIRHAALEKRTTFWKDLLSKINDVVDLAQLHDNSLEADLEKQYNQALSLYETAKLELQFSGPYDDKDVLLSIFAGAGGDDAQDWASMLQRMYTRWAERNNCKIDLLDQSAGDTAGIKSATMYISGLPFLYGRLRSENGVHRLVRLSPFNADNLRQTSFARVEIVPKISSPDDIGIDDKDIKIDVYRSGGKGGQSVNTTDSAVRITHTPTNIVVAIQNERSQLQNKETAMTILRSKLAQLQLEQHKHRVSELKGPTRDAAWGNQIRNYVMHPYSLVKDTRTKLETTDVQSVLDGAIDQFIDAYLESTMQ